MLALTPSQAEIFDQGLSRALLGLAVVGVIGIFLLFFVLREQTKHFQAYVSIPIQKPDEPTPPQP